MASCRGNVAGVWTLRPQATCVGSIPGSSCYVPSRSHCWAGPPADGKGGGPPGTGPAWPASHPMFCSQSLECPGTRSSAPWGDTGAISLISSLDRFLFHSSSGLGRLPAPAAASPSQSVSVPVLAARSHAAGSLGGVLGDSPSPSAVDPRHAFEPNLGTPFPAASLNKLLCP